MNEDENRWAVFENGFKLGNCTNETANIGTILNIAETEDFDYAIFIKR